MGQYPSYVVSNLLWNPWNTQSILDASFQSHGHIVRPCDRHRLSHDQQRLSRGPRGHRRGHETNYRDMQEHDRHMKQHYRLMGEQDHGIEQQSRHSERQLLPQSPHPKHQPRRLRPQSPKPQYQYKGLQSSGQASRLDSCMHHQSDDPQPRPRRRMNQEPLPPRLQQQGPHASRKPSQSDSPPLQPHRSPRDSQPLDPGGRAKYHDNPPQPQGQPPQPRGPSPSRGCPSKPYENPPLTIHVISYSKNIGIPQLLIPTFKFDVSKLSPPKKDMQERFTGQDPELANTFFNTADHEAQYHAMLADTKNAIRRWRCRSKPPSDEVAVLIGCSCWYASKCGGCREAGQGYGRVAWS